MQTKQILQKLIDWQGQTYAAELGIDLTSAAHAEIGKWFLAAVLFGARISESIVKRTYRKFEQAGLLMPRQIVHAGWDRLVEVLDAGGYVRYDFKTADKLLEVMGNLVHNYGGDLNVLHDQSENYPDLTQRLQALGKGIGPTTTQIFLRELRGIWEKANPPVSQLALLCARHLRIVDEGDHPAEILTEHLQKFWKRYGNQSNGFPVFEAALLRVGKNYCRKSRCEECLLKEACVKEV